MGARRGPVRSGPTLGRRIFPTCRGLSMQWRLTVMEVDTSFHSCQRCQDGEVLSDHVSISTCVKHGSVHSFAGRVYATTVPGPMST